MNESESDDPLSVGGIAIFLVAKYLACANLPIVM